MSLNFDTYIFDLDNTLYPSSNGFFARQLDRMTLLIEQLLNVNREEAEFIRDDYYHQYGTTMHGLMQNHGVESKTFLEYFDDVPLDGLKQDDLLIKLLKFLRLNHKKLYIFTNGSKYHAKRLIKHLGFNHLFDGIVTVECTGLIPKPRPEAYEYLFNKFNIDPKTAVFFEDSSHNLITAKHYGMATVLIEADETAHGRFVAHPEIDYLVKDVLSFFAHDYIEMRTGGINGFA